MRDGEVQRLIASTAPIARPSRRRAPGILVVCLGLVAAACSGNATGPAGSPSPGANTPDSTTVSVDGGGAYTSVAPARLAEMLTVKDFVFVNVHTPYEGEIDGTDLAIPFDQIAERADQLPAEKGAKLVIYCRSGRMSDIAARTLVALGYTNVWDLNGGMIAWEAVGYPLVVRPSG